MDKGTAVGLLQSLMAVVAAGVKKGSDMRVVLVVIVIAVCALVLAACGYTKEGDAVRAFVADKGAQAMDESLVNTEWWICNGASVGSIRRRYGSTAKRAMAWQTLCDNPLEAEFLVLP